MPTLQLADLTLHFEDSGSGEKILLIHGLGSSGQSWSAVAARLATDHRLIIPDVRGHGRSGKPAGPYSVPLFARDLAALCDHLGITGLHVIGLSLGGMIGFQLAVDRPDLVRSFVVINSGPDMVPRTLRMWLALKTRVLLLQLFGPAYLGKLLARRLFPKPEQGALREELQTSISANDPDAYLRATRGLIGWTVLPRLSEVVCPVLILASDRDYTPLSAKQAYLALLKDGRLEEIKDSGHAASADQPEQVAAAIIRFVRAVAAPAGPIARA
jgi:pimeloyl-ACP methyl ester carboxylesterase